MLSFFQKKIGGFRNAIKGVAIAWQEHNFRFQVAWGIATLFLAWLFDFSAIEFTIVVLMSGLVLAAETVNTALEELCDKFQPTHDPHIARIKDLGAAAVFIASLAAIVVGLALFIPHLILFF
ncbi:MAG TPA: diacylglycerol kinase [Candidatus Paceibacterota bacterium]